MVEAVRFTNPRSQELSAAVHAPPGWGRGGRAAVVCHGMLSCKDSPKHVRFARELLSRGFLALRVDFAGRGDSQGTLRELTLGGQVEDLGSAVAYLERRGAGRVSLVGSSLGGATAILFAGTHPKIASVATLASVSRPGSLFAEMLTDEQLALWKSRGELVTEHGALGHGFMEDARRQDVVGAASGIRCPALFVHGSEDETVPVRSSKDLHDAVQGEKALHVMEGADHRFSRPVHLDRAIGLVVQWVDAHG